MNRTSLKKNHIFETATEHWKYVAPFITYPKNEAEYDLLVNRLFKGDPTTFIDKNTKNNN